MTLNFDLYLWTVTDAEHRQDEDEAIDNRQARPRRRDSMIDALSVCVTCAICYCYVITTNITSASFL